jgi:hypothetical protein
MEKVTDFFKNFWTEGIFVTVPVLLIVGMILAALFA